MSVEGQVESPVDGRESPTRERTRQALLRAAIGVLAGNPGAPLGDVASAAGVARSTLHRYYADRASLEADVEAFVLAEYAAAVQRSRPDEGTGLDAYVRLCAELLDAHQVFGWWLRAGAEDVGADPTEEDRVVAGIVHRGHADGSVDPELDAEWLTSHIWCGLFAAFHLPESSNRSRRESREMCLRTLRKTAAT